MHFLPRVWTHLVHDVRHPALAELKYWLDTYVPSEQRGAIPIRHNAAELALTA